MRVERITTRQGHPVPKTAHAARGPFPPELFDTPELVSDYTPQPDGNHDAPLGGTAQNNYASIKWFKCKDCNEILREMDIADHICME